MPTVAPLTLAQEWESYVLGQDYSAADLDLRERMAYVVERIATICPDSTPGIGAAQAELARQARAAVEARGESLEGVIGTIRAWRPQRTLSDVRALGAAASDATVLQMPGIAAEAAESRGGMRTRLLDRSGLRSLPTPEPLIADTLDLRTLALLVGPWGSGKSFLALDWACCVATGKPWQGREVRPGRVLYIAAEGAYGLDSRVSAWEYAWRRNVTDKALTVYPDPVNLADRAAVEELLRLVEAERYALVVLDTLARCTVGADENSARDMGLVVDALDRIKRAAGEGVVLAVHHTGKDRATVRGSSAVEGGVDTVYKVDSDGGPSFRLYRDKRKDGPREDELSLALNVVDLGAGVTSCVVAIERQGNSTAGSAGELAVLAAMREAFPSGASRAELARYLRETGGPSEATVYRATTALVTRRILVETSRAGRPFYALSSSHEAVRGGS